MIAQSKSSVDEASIRYISQTQLADLANDIAATRNLNRVEDKILHATKIRLWLLALDYKNYLTREQRERIWYALIEVSGIYDYPKAPVLDKVTEPVPLVGTSIKLYRKTS
jgi:hypothetical protein